MLASHWFALIAMLFLPAGEKPENPWKDKVPPAVKEARRAQTVPAYRTALQTAWQADDWQVGLEIAREALAQCPDASDLRGLAARALWRAGHIAEAERIANQLSIEQSDPVALHLLITAHLARGEHTPAVKATRRLEALCSPTAEDLFHVCAVRMARNDLKGLSTLIRRTEKLVSPDNGYPEIYLGEQLGGLAEFYDAVGAEPLNQLTTFGSAPMPVIPLINLPGCDALINGRGPFRLIVDTGGSIVLSLDEEIATEIGLESIAVSTVHGIAGKEETGQVLVDELKIGAVACRRVMARTFAVRKATAYATDGILGTGIFADARMTLDFQTGRLTLQPSSQSPGPGREVDLRIVGDGKLITPLPLRGQPAAALLDTGADAFAVAPSRLRQLFPDKPIRSVPALALGVGGEQDPSITLTPGVDFEFGGRTYKNYGGLGLDVLDTLLGPLLGIQTDVLIGMPVMREMKTMTVDFPRCRMWVEWLK